MTACALEKREREKERKKNARAQSLPPSAVVSLVALATSCGALGSTQLRKKYAETSKTYFFSSSCCICVFQGFREEPLEEKKTSFFKYGRRRRRGRNCGPSRKKTPRTASTRSRNAEKNTSVSPSGTTPPPTSGLLIQSVVVVGFQEEKSGKGERRGRRGRGRRGRGQPNVEVEVEVGECEIGEGDARSRSAKCRGRRNETSHLFHICHAIRLFVFVPFAPGGSPAATASAGGVARNSAKTRKQRATCRMTERRLHVVSQLFRQISIVIVQLSTLLLPVARAELQIESFANMIAFSGDTAVLSVAKTAQLALVFVKEKNKGRVF